MRWKCEIEYCSKWAESVAGNRWRFLCFCFRWGPKGPALLGGSSSPGRRLSAAAAFRRAFLGLVCNKVTRRRSKDVLFPPSDFGVQRHGGATFWTAFHAFSDGPGTVSPRWASFDSWGWARGVATHAAKCFLFPLKRSTRTCGCHRGGFWVASNSWRCWWW